MLHPAAGFGTQTRCIFEIISRKENCQFGPAFSILVDYEPPNQAGRTIASRQNVGRALCLHGTYFPTVFRARGFSRRLCPANPAGTGDFRRAHGDRGRHDDCLRHPHASHIRRDGICFRRDRCCHL